MSSSNDVLWMDSPELLTAWKTYKEMGEWKQEPRVLVIDFTSDGHVPAQFLLRLRQVPSIGAMNFLKMLGFQYFDEEECIVLDRAEYDSYMNFLRTFNGV